MNLVAKPSKENIKTYLPIGVALVALSFLDVFINGFFTFSIKLFFTINIRLYWFLSYQN